MRRIEVLTKDEIQWVRDNCEALNRTEMADVLDIGRVGLDILLRQLGLENVKPTRTRKDIYSVYDVSCRGGNYDEDTTKFKKKINQIKYFVEHNEGSKIGPYIIIKPYKYHCLVMNSFNCKESLTYADLAKFIK